MITPRVYMPKGVKQLEDNVLPEQDTYLRRGIQLNNDSSSYIGLLFSDGSVMVSGPTSNSFSTGNIKLSLWNEWNSLGHVIVDYSGEYIAERQNARDERLCQHMDVMRNSLVNHTNGQRKGDYSCIKNAGWAQTFHVSELFDAPNHCAYIEHLDVVVFLGERVGDIVHPNSTFAQAERRRHIYTKDMNPCMGLYIDIIDNDHAIRPRFVNVAGKVLKIPTRQDLERENGVYITNTVQGELGDSTGLMKHERFDLNDSDMPIQLFDTFEAARCGGDPKMQLARDYDAFKARADQEALQMKLEIERLKKESQEREMEFKERVEKERYEREQAQAKANEKSTFLKTVGEFFGSVAKIIGAVALIVGPILAVVLKK